LEIQKKKKKKKKKNENGVIWCNGVIMACTSLLEHYVELRLFERCKKHRARDLFEKKKKNIFLKITAICVRSDLG